MIINNVELIIVILVVVVLLMYTLRRKETPSSLPLEQPSSRKRISWDEFFARNDEWGDVYLKEEGVPYGIQGPVLKIERRDDGKIVITSPWIARETRGGWTKTEGLTIPPSIGFSSEWASVYVTQGRITIHIRYLGECILLPKGDPDILDPTNVGGL